MNLEQEVLAELRAKPASGGRLIERLQAAGVEHWHGRAVLVYGALANLAARGEVHVLDEGPGERVFGMEGAGTAKAASPGFPPTFSLGAAELVVVEREVEALTRGLPPHYFEELRRVVVADADRKVFHGERLPRAVARALEELGPRGSVRPFLRRLERKGTAPLRLVPARSFRWLLVPLVLVAVVLLLRAFVVGAYTVPPESISMAPTLVPGVEGGDRLVLAHLLAYRFGEPRRGDVAIVDGHDDRLLVKRVMGLPGEAVAVRGGDLFVNGERYVKDRALLDRLRVPVFRLGDLARTTEGLRTPQPLKTGYPLPEGPWQDEAGPAPDAVVLVRVRATGRGASVLLALHDGRGAPHTVLLESDGPGGAAVGGVEIARGDAFRLRVGVAVEVWLTNADRSFRIEIDRAPAAPPTALADAGRVDLVVTTDGPVEVLELEMARDVIYAPLAKPVRLGRDEYFLLGDNSAKSLDSRTLGQVPRAALRGEVFAVVWPPSRARWIR